MLHHDWIGTFRDLSLLWPYASEGFVNLPFIVPIIWAVPSVWLWWVLSVWWGFEAVKLSPDGDAVWDTFLLCTSIPAFRVFSLGQVDLLIVYGIALSLYGNKSWLGRLIAMSKPQTSGFVWLARIGREELYYMGCAFAASLGFWGMDWPIVLLLKTWGTVAHGISIDLFPYLLPAAPLLIWKYNKTSDGRWLVPIGYCISPYFGLHSMVGIWYLVFTANIWRGWKVLFQLITWVAVLLLLS